MRRITIIGNLTADAEVKSVGDKRAINFSVACNENYKDKSGNKVERVFYYNCTIWRDENVNVAHYLTKGTKVFVEGTPEIEIYKDKQGETKGAIKIIVGNIELIGSGSGKKDVGSTQQSQSQNTDFNISTVAPDGKKDDLPF